MWVAETLSWRLQDFPLALMIERTGERSTVHPPVYFALLRAWTSCFGDTEVGLRSFSALAATGSRMATIRSTGVETRLSLPTVWQRVEQKEFAAETHIPSGSLVVLAHYRRVH